MEDIIKDMFEGQTLTWKIEHDLDDENDQPTEWSTSLPIELKRYSGHLWIDKQTEGFALFNTAISSVPPLSVSRTLKAAMKKAEKYVIKLKEIKEEMEENENEK